MAPFLVPKGPLSYTFWRNYRAPFRDLDSLGPEYCSGALLCPFWPLFWTQKGIYHIQWECIGPKCTQGSFWGPFEAILGHFGVIKEENLDPENHSGAVLSVFRPLFWAQKGLYHIQWECIGP